MKKRETPHTNHNNKWIKNHVIWSSSTDHSEHQFQSLRHTNKSSTLYYTIGDSGKSVDRRILSGCSYYEMIRYLSLANDSFTNSLPMNGNRMRFSQHYSFLPCSLLPLNKHNIPHLVHVYLIKTDNEGTYINANSNCSCFNWLLMLLNAYNSIFKPSISYASISSFLLRYQARCLHTFI